MLQNIIKEMLSFFRNPQEKITILQTNQVHPFRLMLTAYLLFLIPVASSTVFILLAEQLGIVDTQSHAMNELMESMPKAAVFIAAVVFAPLWEELFFRLPLRWERAYFFHVFLLPFYGIGRSTFRKAQHFWRQYYPVIFYSVAILFGAIHIFNFQSNAPAWKMALWLPLLVLPQILLGILLGYIRLRLGFWWCLSLHAMHNFIFVGMAFLIPEEINTSSETRHTDEYKISYQWLKGDQIPETAYNSVSPDTVSFEKITVDELFDFLFSNDSSRYKVSTSAGKKALALTFVPTVESPELKILLLQALETHLGLGTDSTWVQSEIVQLRINAPEKLKPYLRDFSETAGIVIPADSIIFENSNLTTIAKTLEDEFPDLLLEYAGQDQQHYEIRLPRRDFKSVAQTFSTKYGIDIHNVQSESYWEYTLTTTK